MGRGSPTRDGQAVTAGIVVQPEAENDLREAYRWYEVRKAGLGDEFMEEAGHSFHQIANAPLQPRPRYRGTRRVLLRRFPYVVLYLARGDTVFILAVLHGHRDPRMFVSRIKSFES